MKKMMNVVLLGMLIILFAGCSGGNDNTPSTSVAERIAAAQSVALARSEGCTIVDTDTNYSLLSGGENNYISEKGDQTGSIETVKSSITIKCGEQIHNFVFANDTKQSDNVQKANLNPVGDINEFFKTNKTTTEDVAAYITGKLDSTSLCRFSAYPAFTGNIESPETLSVTVNGKECGTPQWYINSNSTPAASGNELVVGTNLSSGENDITIKVTNPAGTNSLYIKRTIGTAFNEPATAVKVKMTPNNTGSVVPEGVFCTKTPSITGSYVVTDTDGSSVIVTEWYDNGVLRQTHTTTLASDTTSGTDTLPGHFASQHTIRFKVTVDGVVSDYTEAKVTCGAVY